MISDPLTYQMKMKSIQDPALSLWIDVVAKSRLCQKSAAVG